MCWHIYRHGVFAVMVRRLESKIDIDILLPRRQRLASYACDNDVVATVVTADERVNKITTQATSGECVLNVNQRQQHRQWICQ